MRKQKLIKEKLAASLNEFAKFAKVREEQATYFRCIRALSADGNADILNALPRYDQVLDPDEIKVFVANDRVGRALSYINRWQLSRGIGKGVELVDTPYCFAVRKRNDLTNFAVLSSSPSNAELKVVEFWTEFSDQYGYGKDFPEVVLAVEDNVVFVLVFKSAEVINLLNWNDLWDLPDITRSLKARLEIYTRIFRHVYVENTWFLGGIPSYDSSKCSLDEHIGNHEERIPKTFFDFCWKGVIDRKDWRKLKRLFNAGKILYIARNNNVNGVLANPLLGVVFSESLSNGITFVYVKGAWDIEVPIGQGVILRMVPDFSQVKRLNK